VRPIKKALKTVTQVTYRADDENNAETFWEALRAGPYPKKVQDDPELLNALNELIRRGEVTMHDGRLIEAFDAFVTSLPGWEDGPEYAKTALIAHAE
jgi:hypothetical protein